MVDKFSFILIIVLVLFLIFTSNIIESFNKIKIIIIIFLLILIIVLIDKTHFERFISNNNTINNIIKSKKIYIITPSICRDKLVKNIFSNRLITSLTLNILKMAK